MPPDPLVAGWRLLFHASHGVMVDSVAVAADERLTVLDVTTEAHTGSPPRYCAPETAGSEVISDLPYFEEPRESGCSTGSLRWGALPWYGDRLTAACRHM
jgi:hypothetical protein